LIKQQKCPIWNTNNGYFGVVKTAPAPTRKMMQLCEILVNITGIGLETGSKCSIIYLVHSGTY
jgi:hypothetical protein